MAENTRLKELTTQVSALALRLQRSEDAQPESLAAFKKELKDEVYGLFDTFQDRIALQMATLSTGTMGTSAGPPPPPPTPDLVRKTFVKMEFPRFADGDPTDWLYNVNLYFQFHNIPMTDRLMLASMHFDKPASRWFQGLAADGLIPDWPSLSQALHRRFGPTVFDDPMASLSKLTQSSSVLDYQNHFEELASLVSGIPPPTLRSIFISGLRPRIRRAVLAHRPPDMSTALALARLYEDQFADERSSRPWPMRTVGPSPPPILPLAAPTPGDWELFPTDW